MPLAQGFYDNGLVFLIPSPHSKIECIMNDGDIPGARTLFGLC